MTLSPAALAPDPARPRPGPAQARFLSRRAGLALGFPMLAAVAWQRDLALWMWVAPMLHCLASPYLFAWLARRRADPRRADCRNLFADHFLGGMWTALVAFSVLPSVLMLCLLCLDSLARGGRWLMLHGLAWHAAGVAAGVLLFGMHWQPEPSLLTVLACLPLLVLQPIVISQTATRAIAKLQQKRAELEHQGRHDGLSGLFNRTHWESLVRSEFARFRRSGQPAALVLADLDHFKRINDVHGHAAGDEAIRRFARALLLELRETDAPGRYGGEEFGILLPHTSAAQAREVIERLRLSLHAHPLLDGTVVTASFGVAELTLAVDTSAAWLRLADQMLYRAKHLGRDRTAVLGDAPIDTGALPASAAPALALLSSAAANAAVMTQLLCGLDMSQAPLALFDPSDRLVLANPAFLALFCVQPGVRTFGGIMRHCFAHRLGPRLDTEDIDVWLRMADGKRRGQPARAFVIDIVDGRMFRVTETSYSDGWVLTEFADLGAPPAPAAAALTQDAMHA